MFKALGKRSSGRTTRMVQEACIKAIDGKRVFIIASQYNDINFINHLISEEIKGHPAEKHITVEAGIPREFDWVLKKMRGYDRNNHVVLFDHHYFEKDLIFLNMLEEAVRWNDGIY